MECYLNDVPLAVGRLFGTNGERWGTMDYFKCLRWQLIVNPVSCKLLQFTQRHWIQFNEVNWNSELLRLILSGKCHMEFNNNKNKILGNCNSLCCREKRDLAHMADFEGVTHQCARYGNWNFYLFITISRDRVSIKMFFFGVPLVLIYFSYWFFFIYKSRSKLRKRYILIKFKTDLRLFIQKLGRNLFGTPISR